MYDKAIERDEVSFKHRLWEREWVKGDGADRDIDLRIFKWGELRFIFHKAVHGTGRTDVNKRQDITRVGSNVQRWV